MGSVEGDIDEEFANIKLTEDEIKKLSTELGEKLVEYGWRDVIRMRCIETAKCLKRDGNLTLDELIANITPIAQSLIPDNVKMDLLKNVKQILDQKTNITHISDDDNS